MISQSLIAAACALILSAGCASNPSAKRTPAKQQLELGYQALDHKKYDAAFARADAVLRQSAPGQPGTAEALYLQGRVFEARAEEAGRAGQAADARRELIAAGDAYVRATRQKPTPRLEGLARAGLANVGYFLDDYPTAVREWGLAFPLIEQPDAKAWILYRTGVCQQRLGWFELADRTFERVKQEFPGAADGEPATRAAALVGVRSFNVQIAAMSTARAADREVATLRQQGIPAVRVGDDRSGKQLVRVGPYRTYADASSVRSRVIGRFPDALIQT